VDAGFICVQNANRTLRKHYRSGEINHIDAEDCIGLAERTALNADAEGPA